MPMSGDSKAIPGMRAALAELAKVPSRLARPTVARLNPRIDEMFQTGTNPYRKPWAPLKPSTIRRKRGNTQILVRTKKLWPGTRFIVNGGAGIALVIGPAGEYAQAGSPNRAVREVVPAYGLPAHWRADIKAVALAELKKAENR
jgi:hypothetical protein